MDLVVITSDDDSFEAPVCQATKAVLITTGSRKFTASQNFKRVMISSDSSDGENDENSGVPLGKENVPTVGSSSPPKIIGLGPEDTASANFPLQTFSNGPQGVQVYPSSPRSLETSKSGPKRFFRWGSGEGDDASVSMFKKRPPTSPSRNEAKKRNIEFDLVEDTVTIGGPSFIPDACNEVDSDCGCSGEDVGVPMPAAILHHRLEIAGVKVDFPLKPYPAQKAVMNALIKGCRNEEHALVESPTGSGKTLALLCGALAWQVQYAENFAVQMAAYANQLCQPPSSVMNPGDKMAKDPDVQRTDGQEEAYPETSSSPQQEMPKRTPKIYYGSRTHRQISQVTKELRRTIYKDTKMTILSSRDFTCIQQGNRNKTELCNELLDPMKKTRCAYYNESNKQEISHYDALQRMNFPMPFDIEEIVDLGTERGCCPYFAARNLMAEADLVLCPYNYLIDPAIRKAMQINLKGAIIILDEAHNIEDICRESASTSFTIKELEAVIEDCEQFHNNFDTRIDKEPEFVELCYFVCTKLKKLIETMPCKKTSDRNPNSSLSSTVWNGTEFCQVLHLHDMPTQITMKFLNAVTQAAEHQAQVREELAAGAKFGVALSIATIRILEKYQFAIGLLRSNEYCNDFRVFVKEATEWIPPSRRQEMALSGACPETIRTLECLCMNPGVIFSSLAQSARSIILASGTLSPIVSFASELGTTFKQVLQNRHVIPRENVHIRVVPKGPNGISLKATYANTSQWNFQDEIGRVILEVCESVPFGVLCFVPSYSLLNLVTQRMNDNGVMDRIRRVKVVFTEPRRNGELDEVMRGYRSTIKELTNNSEKSEVTGALLFAVFRGKIAEGIDFSDNEARAVLTIGIPYAIMTDPTVEQKIKYNDQSKGKQLMGGREWYTVQAYRALNQALGRCIRHINDWGAIMLVDERLMNSQCQQYLPKWIKAMWGVGPNYNTQTMRSELEAFVSERTEAEKLRKIEDP